MMVQDYKTLPSFMDGLCGELKLNEPMARHTTWRAGGCAEYFYSPAGKQDLIRCLQQIPENMRVYWVGMGSNLLVRDGGLSGLVICTLRCMNRIAKQGSHHLYAESGASSARVARSAIDYELSGVEFLAGIPGSIGGALAMNAGAYGKQTWDWVQSAEVIDRSGRLSRLNPDQIETGYRKVALPKDNWFLSAVFDLQPSISIKDKERLDALLNKRRQTQPIQTANAGSVFKNPQSDYAARLVESVGLKGERCGGAVISQQHANFIINQDNASASDIETLIKLAHDRVKLAFGIDLETEVRIVGVTA